MTMKTGKPTTAAETFAKTKSDIAKLIDVLEMEVDALTVESELKPRDWSFAGDMIEVRRKLIEAVSFLSGHSEETVSKFCEE